MIKRCFNGWLDTIFTFCGSFGLHIMILRLLGSNLGSTRILTFIIIHAIIAFIFFMRKFYQNYKIVKKYPEMFDEEYNPKNYERCSECKRIDWNKMKKE